MLVFVSIILYAFIIAILLIGLLILCYTGYIGHKHYTYSHIPCPPLPSFFMGHVSVLTEYSKRYTTFDDAILEWTQEFGPVIVIFLAHYEMVLTVNAKAVKDIVISGANTHYKPAMMYAPFQIVYGQRLLGGGLVTEINHDRWIQRRSMLNPAFHRKYLKGLMCQFNASADLLVSSLSTVADGKSEVVLLNHLAKATLDAIAKAAFGVDLDIFKEGESIFDQAISKVLEGLMFVFNNPLIKYDPRQWARQMRQETTKAARDLRQIGAQTIRDRIDAANRGADVPRDILTCIIDAYEEGLDHEQQIQDMLDEFVTFFIAGQDTTANLLAFTILALGRHPEVMQRLRTEVNAVIGMESFIKYDDLGHLDYMMTVLKESLRLWPPVSGTSRLLGHDVEIAGYKVKRGTLVGFSSQAMSRMEEYFKNPLHFDPDRFKIKEDKPDFAYFPFSLGPRTCIGQRFALIEARVILTKLVQNFQFELVPDQNFGIKAEASKKPADGCKCFITKLNSDITSDVCLQ